MPLDNKSSNPLVSSDDVNGTKVYGTDGEEVGHIDHLMIDKKSGNVSYAVMGFGGFLGMGEGRHPIPWAKLSYATDKNGFVTDISLEQLEGAPDHEGDWFRDRDFEQRIHDHYMVPYYWV